MATISATQEQVMHVHQEIHTYVLQICLPSGAWLREVWWLHQGVPDAVHSQLAHLELVQCSLHLLGCLLKGWGAGDDLCQQGVVVSGDDIPGGDGSVHTDAWATGDTVCLQTPGVRLRKDACVTRQHMV